MVLVKDGEDQFDVLMNIEIHNSYNLFLSHDFCLLYVFRKNLVVHLQEQIIIYCLCNTEYYDLFLKMND